VEISLPSSGVTLVSGKNLDSGGDSGSGKTSLVNSIAYLFNYCHTPATELKSWYCDSMSVSANILIDDQKVKFSRSPGAFVIQQGDVVTRGEAAEKLLQKWHKLPSGFIESMAYRHQQKPGKPSGGFLGISPADKARFLSKLLDLDKYETSYEASKQTLDALEKQLVLVDGNSLHWQKESEQAKQKLNELVDQDFGISGMEMDLSRTESNLREAQRRLLLRKEAALEIEQKDSEQKEIVKLETSNKVSSISSTVVDTSEVDAKIQKAVDILQQLTFNEKVLYDNFQQNRTKARERLSAINRQLSIWGDLDSRIADLRAQLVDLEQRRCSKCQRLWIDSQDAPEAHSWADEMQSTKDELAKLVEARECKQGMTEIMIPEIEAIISEQFAADPRIQKLEKLKQKLEFQRTLQINEFENNKRQQICSLQESMRAELAKGLSDPIFQSISQYNSLIQKLQLEMANKKSRLETAQEQHQSRIALRNERNERLQRATEKLVEIDAERIALTEQINEEKDFALLVGRTGYLGAIFEEVLADISSRASAMMSLIPNISHCSIRLNTTKVTKSGEKRTIHPTVMINGLERPFSSCSGGMTNSITLAVDLAVRQVISERIGISLGWLVLDECFDGMDMASKEACLSLLRDVSEEQQILIFVIERDSIKEMFETVIEVVCENGRSSITKEK